MLSKALVISLTVTSSATTMLNQDIMIHGKVYSSHSDTSEVCSTKASSRTLEIKAITAIKENEDSHPTALRSSLLKK